MVAAKRNPQVSRGKTNWFFMGHYDWSLAVELPLYSSACLFTDNTGRPKASPQGRGLAPL